MVDDEFIDAGQSAFWANQAVVQAPPPEIETPQKKKRRVMITAGISFFILLFILIVVAPKQRSVGPAPTPVVSASPTPKPLQSEIVQQFNDIDQQLQSADLTTIVAPPQVNMQVDF